MNELLEPLAAEPLVPVPADDEPQPTPGPAVPHLPRLPSHLTRRADGEVIVTGTRVRAVDVFAAVASGVRLDDLAEAFPQVRPDRLAGVVAFRASHLKAVDAYTRWRSERTGPTGPTGASRPKVQTRPSTASEPHGASDQGMGALASAGVSNGMTGPPAASVAPAELSATAAPAAHTPPAAPTAPAAPAPAPAGLRAPAEPAEPRHPEPAE